MKRKKNQKDSSLAKVKGMPNKQKNIKNNDLKPQSNIKRYQFFYFNGLLKKTRVNEMIQF